MELLAPSALWWLPALALLLLLPRIRTPAKRSAVATLQFWHQARTREAARPLVRLRRHLLLLVQAAAILAIIAALARPVLLSGAREIVLVLDLSASMAAASSGGTRLADARSALVDIAADLPLGSRITVITAGATVNSLGTFGARSRELGAAIAAVQPGTGEAHLDEAISTARSLSLGDVTVMTDDPATLAREDIQAVAIGTAADNVAISLFAVRRLPDSPLDAEALVTVKNFGGAAARGLLSIATSDDVLHREQYLLEPGGVHQTALVVPASGPELEARIDAQDALPLDNRHVARLPPPVRVAVAGTVSRFLRAALEANPDVALAAGPDDADVLVCGGCTEAPSGKAAVLLVPAAGARVQKPRPVEDRGRRVMQLDIDSYDEAAVREPRFPVRVAGAINWLAAREAASDGRFPASESDLRAGVTAAAAPVSAGVRSTRGRTLLAPVLFVLAAALLGLEWFVPPRRVAPGAGAKLLRAALVAVLLLAAAGVAVPIGPGRTSVVFAVDRSHSVPAAVQAAATTQVQEMAARMGGQDRAAVIGFGADAAVERPLDRGTPDAIGAAAVNAGGTDIAAALRLARSMLPQAGARRIVLLTDGRATSGDAAEEAAVAAAADIRIDAIGLGGGRTGGRIANVRAPARVRSGEPFDVTVRIDAPPRSSTSVTLFRDGSPVHAGPVIASETGAGTLTFTDTIRGDAVVTYTAVGGPDPLPELARAGTAVVSTEPPAVLYVSPHAPAAGSSGITIVRRLPGALPMSADALSRYHVIVLDDVAAEDLEVRQSDALADYVLAGGGLVIRGGDSVLGPAGYPQSPLDPLMPVDFRGRGGSRAPDMAFVVAFDKSGSMADAAGATTKIELARRAVLAVKDVLPPGDALGVIAFDSEPSAAATLDAAMSAAELRERLNRIAPRGSTRIAPAVALAREWLDASPAARKHILLISDGRSDEADAAAVQALLRDRKTELTIVAAGDDSDRAFFTRLAAGAGARVYFPAEVSGLPAIVAREAARTNGGWRVRERFTPRVNAGHPVARGVAARELPPLDGYVAGALRPGAEAVLTSHLGDPVLATGGHGLGRVAVLAADGPLEDPDDAFAQTWTQSIRWAAAGRADSVLDLQLLQHQAGTGLAVDAVAPDGSFMNGYEGTAVVRPPSGEARSVPLEQTAPGRYAADAIFEERGTHLVTVSLRSTDGTELAARQAVYWSAPAEQGHERPDVDQLSRIVAAGGGQLIEAASANPFESPGRREPRDVSAVLGAAALVVLLADVAARRGVRLRRRPRPLVKAA